MVMKRAPAPAATVAMSRRQAVEVPDPTNEHVTEHVGRVVRPGQSYVGKQGLRYTPGVSAESVGSTSLWLGSVPVPPGARTKAHVHEHHESAFYMVSGDEVELWTGDQL